MRYIIYILSSVQSKMQLEIGKHDHEYILSPVSATACVKRNMNEAPLRSRSTPRLTCDLKLDKFPLSLSDAQYRQAVRLDLFCYHLHNIGSLILCSQMKKLSTNMENPEIVKDLY